MGKQLFKLNGAGIVDYARVGHLHAEENEITDGSFAVISGLMFELCEVELNTGSYAALVTVYDAADVHDLSHVNDMLAADSASNAADIMNTFNNTRYIVGFEFCASDDDRAGAYEKGERLFVHLIEQALFNSNSTRMHLCNFAIGNDLDCIKGVTQ